MFVGLYRVFQWQTYFPWKGEGFGEIPQHECGPSSSCITKLALGPEAPAWHRSLSVLSCCVTYLSLCVVKGKGLEVRNLEVGLPEV